MTSLWISQSNASQRDVIGLIKGSERWATVVASHFKDREDILSGADVALREPVDPKDALASGPSLGDGYADWMLATAREHGVHAILAHRRRDHLVRHLDRFRDAGIRLSAGATSLAMLDVCERKDRFTDFIAPIAETARTHLVNTSADLAAAVARFEPGAELCVKPAVGVFGRGFLRLSPAGDMFTALMTIGERAVSVDILAQALDATVRPEPLLLMEWLPGPEYSVDMVCDAGATIAAVSRLKTDHYQIIETRGPQVEIARAIAAALQLDGIVNVQTRGGADGRQKVLEVNTRIPGGIGYSAPAGVNLPAMWARHVTGRPVDFHHLSDPVAVRVATAPYVLPATTRLLAELGERAA